MHTENAFVQSVVLVMTDGPGARWRRIFQVHCFALTRPAWTNKVRGSKSTNRLVEGRKKGKGVQLDVQAVAEDFSTSGIHPVRQRFGRPVRVAINQPLSFTSQQSIHTMRRPSLGREQEQEMCACISSIIILPREKGKEELRERRKGNTMNKR
eukprot:m.33496 g.33496  ORF g.33496 m.33496 type:complete len:153 (+) comp10891_c0_seq2:301-759(+)